MQMEMQMELFYLTIALLAFALWLGAMFARIIRTAGR